MAGFNFLRKSISLTVTLLAPVMIAGAVPAAAQVQNSDNTHQSTLQQDKQNIRIQMSGLDGVILPIERQELVRETALADIQKEVVTAEQGVQIAKLQASAAIEQANGEAESIRLTGDAKADAYKAGVNALGSQAYTALQLMQVIGDRQVRVVPDVAVSGNNGSGLLDAMMGLMVWNQTSSS